jgi:hypothetical protein
MELEIEPTYMPRVPSHASQLIWAGVCDFPECRTISLDGRSASPNFKPEFALFQKGTLAAELGPERRLEAGFAISKRTN